MNPFFIIHKKKCTAGAVLLASVLLFGFNGTMDRLSVALGQAREKADEIMPTDTLLALARKQIVSAEEQLRTAEAATQGHQGEEARTRQTVSRLQAAAAEARQRLETLRPALTSSSGFTHCGTQYSLAEVRQDAVRLAAFIQQCDSEIAVKQAQLQELDAARSGGDQTLQAARLDFQEAKTRFAELEVRLKQQQAVAEATQAARAARAGLNEELEGDFARTLSTLESRLGKLQRQNESLRADQGGLPSGNVRFEPTGTDPVALVDTVLGRQTAAR